MGMCKIFIEFLGVGDNRENSFNKNWLGCHWVEMISHLHFTRDEKVGQVCECAIGDNNNE
jgi:hypothetical protein